MDISNRFEICQLSLSQGRISTSNVLTGGALIGVEVDLSRHMYAVHELQLVQATPKSQAVVLEQTSLEVDVIQAAVSMTETGAVVSTLVLKGPHTHTHT